jgi:hypothetical protein
VNSSPRSQQKKEGRSACLEKVFELLITRSNQDINDECNHSGKKTATILFQNANIFVDFVFF